MKARKSDTGFLRGEITVFLSLLLMLIVAFLMNLTIAAKLQLAKGEARSLSEMAMESLFGEYRTELLEDYEIFLLDGGYRTGNYSEDAVLRHYDLYARGMQDEKNTLLSYHPVNWGLGPSETKIISLRLATDDKGAAVLEQISNYMQVHTGAELLQKLTGNGESLMQNAEQLLREGDTYERESRENESTMHALEEELQAQMETEGGSLPVQGQVPESPLDAVRAVQAGGVLGAVVPEGRSVSGKTIPLTQTVSHRSLRKGYGQADYLTTRNTFLDRALFYAYLPERLTSFTKREGAVQQEKMPHQLEYEMEYLVAGKASDRENLEAVTKKLLLMREGANFAYLLTDSAKQAQAETLAALIAGYAGMPPLIEAVKWSLLLAWAYGESVLDVRMLLNGGKLSVVKTAGNWKLSLENLGDLASLGTPEGESTGMEYKDWILLLLYAGNTSDQVLRFCDLAEANIRLEQGNTSFRMDDCIAGMSIETTREVGSGITYTFPMSYGYH